MPEVDWGSFRSTLRGLGVCVCCSVTAPNVNWTLQIIRHSNNNLLSYSLFNVAKMRSFKYIILSGKFGWRVWLQWWRLHGCWFDANFIRQYVRSASSISCLEKWQPTAAGSIDSSNVLSSGILMWVCRLFTYSQGNFIQSSWNVIKYLWKLVELHVWTSLKLHWNIHSTLFYVAHLSTVCM